ncbi:MAG TPA: hypothetical protein VE993_11275, partial [Stellaceae bacterium]|nr:hypothetical protein [Stellaceae bacterium]
FHARGPSTGPSMRVEIWAYGRRSPFPSPAPFIPWTTAGLAWRSRLGWRVDGLLAAAGLKKNRWRLVTGVSAFDPPPPREESRAA